jgi:hypothetical protein
LTCVPSFPSQVTAFGSFGRQTGVLVFDMREEEQVRSFLFLLSFLTAPYTTCQIDDEQAKKQDESVWVAQAIALSVFAHSLLGFCLGLTFLKYTCA